MKTFLLATALILLSCNAEKSQASRAADLQAEDAYNSSFTGFFMRFMQDEAFQRARILFPIQIPGRTVAHAGAWEYLPFYAQREYIPALAPDTLSLFEQNLNPGPAELLILDIDRGSADKFVFSKVNAQWHLQRFETLALKESPDYEFLEFLIAFSSDPAFQARHIGFPLPELFSDPDNGYETASRTIRQEDWEFRDLKNTIQPLLTASGMQTGSRYRNLSFSGVENGIWVVYRFEKRNGSWLLIRTEDYST
jgi:hypothetical protein